MTRSTPLPAFLLVLTVGIISIARPGVAEEPSEEFLRQLRAVGYYDTALLYLERVRQGQFGSYELRQVVDLEEAQVRLEAASAARSAAQRERLLADAETSLRAFLESDPESDRAPEARLQLANVLMVRGAQRMQDDASDEAARAEAREAFTSAAESFDATADDVRERLKALQGERIDAAEQPELVARRDRYRRQFLQALLLGGNARERIAETYPEGDDQAEQPLNEALERYQELTDKYSRYVPGVLAMLYQGQVQEKLGQRDAALDSYQRVLEQEEIDELRKAKTKAMTAAIGLWLDRDPPQASAAVGRGQPWLDTIRPNERNEADWQRLRVQLAKAHLERARQQAEESGGATKAKRSRASAQQMLNAAARIPGDHQSEARDLLGELGVESETVELADVVEAESFEEALDAARELIDKAESESLALKVIEEKRQGGEGDPGELADRRAEIEETIDTIRAQAAQLLTDGMAMATDETDDDEINRARYYLAYLQLKRGRLREAAVVGEFLARRFPTNSLAPQAGILAMTAYQGMLREQADAPDPAVLANLEQVAEYLMAKWPSDPQAGAAGELLVRIALSNDRWDDARASLEKLPESSAKRGELQRLLGQLQWNAYLKAVQSENEEAPEMLDRAIDDLTAGLEGLAAADADPAALQAAHVLAKARLEKDDAAGALAALDDEAAGPLQRLGEDGIAPPSPGFPSEAYGTALRVLVTLATTSDDAEARLDQAAKVMDRMRGAVDGLPDGEARLASIYFGLAKDIRRQLDAAPPARQTKLISAFRLLLERLTDTVDDPATLHWIARTMMEMGASQMDDEQRSATGSAEELLAGAADAYRRLLDQGAVENEPQVRYELARTDRLRGNYSDAVDGLARVLKDQNSMIDAQIEAALAYQQWARDGSPDRYQSAMVGDRKDPETGRNTIWGWGRISQLTASRPEHRDRFFEARYRLAQSRYQLGAQQSDSAEKRRLAEQAAEDIRQIARLYPDFGGPESRDRFDSLLRQIQRARGVPPEGLTEFQDGDATAASDANDGDDRGAAATTAASGLQPTGGASPSDGPPGSANATTPASEPASASLSLPLLLGVGAVFLATAVAVGSLSVRKRRRKIKFS